MSRIGVSFEIRKMEGIENLIDAVTLGIKAPGRAVIGIVADADCDPVARWSAISHRLRKAEVEPPKTQPPDGTILDGRPRVGVRLMPNNQKPGELEDFVREMIPSCDPAWPLAKEYPIVA